MERAADFAAGFVKFVSTLAPAWVADGRPIYGGFFWINGDGALPVPKDTYYMAGAGGQYTMIIPSHDLVVVRLGHFKGDRIGSEDLNKALPLLLEAVPSHPRVTLEGCEISLTGSQGRCRLLRRVVTKE